MANKNYCTSANLAFHCIERPNREFKERPHHTSDVPYPERKRAFIQNALLRPQYSDYWQLPSEEKRVGHQPYQLSFEKDYLE